MKKVLVCAALLGMLFLCGSCDVDGMYEVSCREQCKTDRDECKNKLLPIGCDSKYNTCIDNCR